MVPSALTTKRVVLTHAHFAVGLFTTRLVVDFTTPMPVGRLPYKERTFTLDKTSTQGRVRARSIPQDVAAAPVFFTDALFALGVFAPRRSIIETTVRVCRARAPLFAFVVRNGDANRIPRRLTTKGV